MIVTRQRKKKRSFGKLLLPVVALAALAVAFLWPPSHNVIVNGPLKPVFNAGGNVGAVVVKPLTFAGQQQTIADRNRAIRDLNAQLEQERVAKTAADARAQQAQQQAAALAAQPKATPVPAPRPRVSAAGSAIGANAAAPGAGAPAAAPTEAEKRLASAWAAMEPEKAAAVVQRLPDDEVTRVLAAMEPESAGNILNALPPAVAARISRASAQVSPVSNR